MISQGGIIRTTIWTIFYAMFYKLYLEDVLYETITLLSREENNKTILAELKGDLRKLFGS